MAENQRLLAVGGLSALTGSLVVRLMTELATGWWRWRSRNALQRIETTLRSVDEMLEIGKRALIRYHPHDPEPYGASTLALERSLRADQASYDAYRRQKAQLLRPRDHRRIYGKAFMLVYGFLLTAYDARHTACDAAALLNLVQALQIASVHEVTTADTLRTMPCRVAKRIRKLVRDIACVQEYAVGLSQKGVHGTTLDTLFQTLNTIVESLAALPEWVSGDPEGLLLWRAENNLADTKAAISRAWRVAEDVEPVLRLHINDLRAWRSQYDGVVWRLDALDDRIEFARDCMRSIPAQIDIEELGHALWQLDSEAMALRDQFGQPTIEALHTLAVSTDIALGEIGRVTQRLVDVERDFESLQDRVRRNHQILQPVMNQMDALEQVIDHPVQWQSSQNLLSRIRLSIDEIEPLERPRSCRRLAEDIDTARRIHTWVLALSKSVSQVRRLRAEVMRLFSDLASLTPPDLLAVHELCRKTGGYALENWTPQDSVRTIEADAMQILDRRLALLPVERGQPLEEDLIAQKAMDLDTLVVDTRAFCSRVLRVNQALGEIVQIEKVVKRETSDTMRSLQRLKAYPYDRDRLLAAGRDLQSWLAERGRGRIIDKAERLSSWHGACEQVLGQLMAKSQSQVDTTLQFLVERIASLQSVAPFGREPAMLYARQVAQDVQVRQPNESIGGSSGIEHSVTKISYLDKLAADLERASSRLSNELGNKIEGRITRLKGSHDQARQAYEQLLRLNDREQAKWPPAGCPVAAVISAWERAVTLADELRLTGHTADDVVPDLSTLMLRYEDVIDKAHQARDVIANQRRSMDDLIGRINVHLGKYSRRLRQEGRDSDVGRAIQERMDRVRELLQDGEASHRHHPLTYNQAFDRLHSILGIADAVLTTAQGRIIQNLTVGSIQADGSVSLSQSANSRE